MQVNGVIGKQNFGALKYASPMQPKDANFLDKNVKPHMDNALIDYLDYLGYDIKLSLIARQNSKNRNNIKLYVRMDQIDKTNNELVSAKYIKVDENLPQKIYTSNQILESRFCD